MPGSQYADIVGKLQIVKKDKIMYEMPLIVSHKDCGLVFYHGIIWFKSTIQELAHRRERRP